MLYLYVAAAAILVAMLLAVVRGLLGPTIYDRIVAANNFGTNTVLLICIIAFWSGRFEYLDLALTYALISFVANIAVLKFFELGDFAQPYVTPKDGAL